MAIELGTRQKQNFHYVGQPSRHRDRGLTRDVGMSKNVTASITFVAGGTNQLQAANGTFTPFAVNDPILVEGTNLNNGDFTVLAIDSVNHAFLTVDVPPQAEGPITATVRTP